MIFLYSTVVLAVLAAVIGASPIAAPIPAAVQSSEFAAAVDFPVNVVFLSGPAQFGLWIPQDGIWRDASTFTCLNMPSYTYGACNIPTVDQIGIVAGSGPCNFVGTSGAWLTVPANAGGFVTLGPPQTLWTFACGG